MNTFIGRERQMETKDGKMACGAEMYGLPEEIIVNILSLTTPADACRLSLVSKFFRSAADSDDVWERFPPSDYQSVVAQSYGSSPSPSVIPLKKKQLFFHLCDNSFLIDGGMKSFSLDKWSGKKSFMIAARDLAITWGSTPDYWRWIFLSKSRFAEVAELVNACWLEIHGKINTSMLSPETTYVAYLVCNFANAIGFKNSPANASVGIIGDEHCKRTVYLNAKEEQRWQDPKQRHDRLFDRIYGRLHDQIYRANQRWLYDQIYRANLANLALRDLQFPMPGEKVGQFPEDQLPQERGDGWLEIQLGEYYIEGGEDRELEMSLMDVESGHWKCGLIIQGIELRPKRECYK